jgi:hypothetical protein
MTPEMEDIIRRFLQYSFDGIQYQWDNLTEDEKTFATEAEYEKLVVWVQA